MTLFEIDEASVRVREEVDADADVIVGAIFDDALAGKFRVSVVATGLRQTAEVVELGQRIA
jgi:cell division protein FtsZ